MFYLYHFYILINTSDQLPSKYVFNRLPEQHHNKYFTYCLAILINIKNIVVAFMLAFWDIFVCLVVRKQCLKIIPEESYFVDEQIIPTKTRYSTIQQHNPRKPARWGFNNMVRAESSGTMYDYYIYNHCSRRCERSAKVCPSCRQSVLDSANTCQSQAFYR